MICSASSGRRAQSTVGVLTLASAATVVPHDPAPMTATRISDERDMAAAYAPAEPAAVVAAAPRGLRAPSLRVVDLAALIPVKSFRAAKARLAGVLTDEERARLARAMATRVVEAARPLPTFVACDHDEVASFAEELGATVLWGPGLGLNGAVDHGVSTVAGKGFDHVVIAHGDLPLASDLGGLARPGEIVIVPDRRRDGTNVLARPCGLMLPAAYGPGSFRSHYRAAVATGARVTVRIDRRLAIDIDTLADCVHPLAAPVVTELLGRAPA